MAKLSVRQLYRDNQDKLSLSWVTGREGLDSQISINNEEQEQWSFVGHLNLIHPNKIQVIGPSEHQYLTEKIQENQFLTFFDIVSHNKICLIIVANNLTISNKLKKVCTAQGVPLMRSKMESSQIIQLLQLYLQRALALSIVMHGVFLNVFEVGTLVQGDSGLGKSELALELLSRGHSLIADDAVRIYKMGPETLEGRCPEVLQDFLEVRGLGVLNVRTMFGETAVRFKKRLKLIIQLISADDDYMKNMDRLSMHMETQTILDVPMRKVMIPVGPGRNIAVLTESAVRQYILQLRGLNSTQEFLERHHRAMSAKELTPLDDDDAYGD